MADGRLVIGTRRYSSWSLRGWLPVRLAGLDVEIQALRLAGGGKTVALKTLSPNGCAPYLEHKGIAVWDSLAIAEYCAELAPALWPQARAARAHARSITAEMHAGFRAVRSALPMNLGRVNRPLAAGLEEDTLRDIARIDAIWTDTRNRFGAEGPYLFGATFCNADAAFAPVVSRFASYAVPCLSDVSHAYMRAVQEHALMREWAADAAREPQDWQLEMYESLS
ncbi:glutathione S-transferase [Acetobacter suratthaniensis]|jgi:glutathione S-transferase|uniref:Glutathione S-transferase n=1 Tax=Acetobacter suratthaniensis TaxID=1502841 RepID=A0ABS3LMU1_9PROT|nr:glutathione S-transferase [Acetobacter suratthaniensis]MBO1328686.1 glutathione S-transferase [Acetobacter suratthaniensis]MCX2566864.1 glutathione S-transferase [Acetobacter suratthaniensis]